MRSKKSIIITPPILLLLTITPFVHPDKFCGTSLEDAQSTCWQPCGTDSDCCSLSQKCYETEESCGSSIYEGTQHNYCGISWCDAAYTCTTPCEDNVCPEGMGCYSNTPCGGSSSVVVELPPDPVESDSSYCGHSLEDAKMTCWQPCPRGDSDCCLGLKCFDTANTNIDDIDGGSSNSSSSSTSSGLGQCGVANYEGANHYYCGKSWCDAAYTCGEPCPGGSHEECTGGNYCYADVPCTTSRNVPEELLVPAPTPSGSNVVETGYRYCGVDAGDATERCWQECSSDADCCFDQYCFDTGSNCGRAFYDGPNHSYCGTSRCDAISKCSVPCPNGNECPEGEMCFDNTPCDSDINTNQPYYCGLSEAEAASKCWQPCPGGQDSECCFGQTCFNIGFACMETHDDSINHKFCGVDKCDANHKCSTPCPNGDECPAGESCFDDTPCSSNVEPPSYNFAYCGTSLEDAVSTCWQPCRDDSDCCFGQTCYASAIDCEAPNFSGSAHFFCGTDFCDASFRCPKPCQSGFDAECDIGERCYANTPCDADLDARSYGLPRSAMNLAIQYIPPPTELKSGAESKSLRNTNLIIALTMTFLLARV